MAASLNAIGMQAICVALNDKHLRVDETEERQHDGQSEIDAHRYSQSLPWKTKIEKLQDLIHHFNPGWLSFQYVPYGFDKKGIPFYLHKMLRQLHGSFKWHFMFHETWAGISDVVPVTYKVYGYLQKRIARDLISAIQPQCITTTNLLYQLVLKEQGIAADCLPLFSNISVHEQDDAFIASIEEKYSVNLRNDGCYKLGIFGTSYPEADLGSVVPKFIKDTKPGKKIVLLVFGKNNSPEEIDKLKTSTNPDVVFTELGELAETKVSSVMRILDQAILCTPFEYIGKSGAYAALRLHNVAVATLSSAPIARYESTIRQYNDYLSKRQAGKWSVAHVRDKFIALLNNYPGH
jgi:hypothetical protein